MKRPGEPGPAGGSGAPPAAPAREPVEGFVTVGAGRLHFLDWGGTDGRIQAHLLHANGFCAGTYAPFVRFLLDDLHVMASDIRGHGGSDKIGGDRIRHWKVFADDLNHIVRNVMAPPVLGMGHSLGAVATYIAAARAPELFTGLVLMDPVILPRSRLWILQALGMMRLRRMIPLARGARRRKHTFKDRMEAFQRFAAGRGLFRTWSDTFIDAYLECGLLEKDAETAVLRCDPELEARIFESVPLDAWSYARRIQCPVLVIRGQLSDTLAPEVAEAFSAALADCRLETVPNAGHFFPMEQPEACARSIVRFAAGLPDARHPPPCSSATLPASGSLP